MSIPTKSPGGRPVAPVVVDLTEPELEHWRQDLRAGQRGEVLSPADVRRLERGVPVPADLAPTAATGRAGRRARRGRQ